MTEEDTFNLLRRTPIEDMHPVMVSRFWHFYKYPNEYKEWLANNGWDEIKFREAGTKFLNLQGGIYAND